MAGRARRVLAGVGALAAIAGLVAAIGAPLGLFSGSRPADLGLADGKLRGGNARPNWVSSQVPATDSHYVAPIAASGGSERAWRALEAAVWAEPGARVVTLRPGYLHAEFSTKSMGFVDDAEFALDAAAGLIHVRAGARLGIRDFGVKMKHSANLAVVKGRRIVLIDDSVVRGTTSKKIVTMMRDAGAREVHMRIACPEIKFGDFYGIDTPSRKELLAARMSVEEMREFMGADSLAFLTVDGLYRAMGLDGRDDKSPQFTDHCFTGDYPTPLTDQNGGGASFQLSLLAEVR
jgi:uncharacterized protein (DUF1499 family)